MDDFKRAIDILGNCRFHGALNLSGGEPTFHDQLPELLDYASAKLQDARISLFTNGSWIGEEGWREKLGTLFPSDNVLIRFSHDRQHSEGFLRAAGLKPDAKQVSDMDRKRTRQAGMFRDAMLAIGARPGVNFDFAYKGTLQEAEAYMKDLGEVPVYLIKLREDPERRPREFGFLAIDVQDNDDLLVYPTLGHIPDREPLGGLETLEKALNLNRARLENKGTQDEQRKWTGKNRD